MTFPELFFCLDYLIARFCDCESARFASECIVIGANSES